MASQNFENNEIPFENIEKGASSTSNSVERLVIFLEKYLPTFPKEQSLNNSMSEEDLSEELWEFLTLKCRTNSSPFAFKPEKKQKKQAQKGHPRRVDFGVFQVQDNTLELIYTLEAKKLPTGKGDREKEYVLGNYGGIERFKQEQHGIDKDGNLIERNGIVAYILENTVQFWQKSINSWISDASWNSSELLNLEYELPIGKLNSRHDKTSGAPLYLDHFWVKI